MNRAINRDSGSGRFPPPLSTFRVRYTRVLQQPRRRSERAVQALSSHSLCILEPYILTVKQSQATDRARRAVWTHHGPIRTHLADYSLRQRRDGNASTTILYHLHICRRPHSSSVMTAGRRDLLVHGHSRHIKSARCSVRPVVPQKVLLPRRMRRRCPSFNSSRQPAVIPGD